MAQTAIHLREQIFDFQQGFSGKFTKNVQEKSVPSLLSSLLLIYNAVKEKPTKSVASIQHRAERETPLPVYVALKVYAATEHSEETINRLGCVYRMLE